MSAFETIAQFTRMLKNLDQWLQAGTAYAQKKNFDPDVLAQARLAPDQYALVQQVQSACDAAKYAAAYLSGQKAPSHPDTEKTIAELRARIRTCMEYLDDFQGGRLHRRRRAACRAAVDGGQLGARRSVHDAHRRAELLLPRHHGLRHPAPQRRRPRQARLRRRARAGRIFRTERREADSPH